MAPARKPRFKPAYVLRREARARALECRRFFALLDMLNHGLAVADASLDLRAVAHADALRPGRSLRHGEIVPGACHGCS